MSEFEFNAREAGLYYSLSRDTHGLLLSVYGFNDKFHFLLAKLVDEMRNLIVNHENLDFIRDSLVKKHRKRKFMTSSEHAKRCARLVLTTRQWTDDEIEGALRGLHVPLVLFYFKR